MSRALPHLGKYRVQRRIGAGGMAEVYACQLAGPGGFDKTVAVKTLRPEHRGNAELVRMFLEEARIAARVNHPNVVQIFEVDQVDGAPCIAMELVRGPNLFALLQAAHRRRRMQFLYGAKLVAGMCAGLHAAHTATGSDGAALRVVHRDVSPQNVLISTEGQAKLLDFGIAKAHDRLGAAADDGHLKGKLRYLAPELLEGGEANPLTDVYAAGACLFEAVVGEPIYAGLQGEALAAAVRAGPWKRASEVFPGCPAGLEQIVSWALERDPADRCPDARQLGQALEEFLARQEGPVTDADVADWVLDLFPELDSESWELRAATAVPRTSEVKRPTVTLTPPPPPPEVTAPRVVLSVAPRGNYADLADAGAAGAIEDTAAGPQTRLLQAVPTAVSRSEPVVPTASPPRLLLAALGLVAGTVLGAALHSLSVPPPVPADATAKASVVAYLDGAQTLADQQRYDSASDLIDRAGAIRLSDTALTVRLVALRGRVTLDGSVMRFRRELAIGDKEAARGELLRISAMEAPPELLTQLRAELESGVPGKAQAAAPPKAEGQTAAPNPAGPVAVAEGPRAAKAEVVR
jgi:serine/threonine-protein kinase